MALPVMENTTASGAANTQTAEEASAWAQIHAMLKEIEQMREDIRIDREQVAKDAAKTRANLDFLKRHRA